MTFLDRKVLRAKMRESLTSRSVALNDSSVAIDDACDEMIDLVIDAVAQGAVSKGMEFARGLLAKRGKGDE